MTSPFASSYMTGSPQQVYTTNAGSKSPTSYVTGVQGMQGIQGMHAIQGTAIQGYHQHAMAYGVPMQQQMVGYEVIQQPQYMQVVEQPMMQMVEQVQVIEQPMMQLVRRAHSIQL
jgi:hypothetical protein